MKTPEEFISDNGYGKGTNFTIETVASLMKQYTLSLLSSNEEIKITEFDRNRKMDYDELLSAAYRLGRWHLKEEIINKLK